MITCKVFEEEMATELALGTLAGDERAEALEHVTSCSRCRLRVDELAQASDALLLMAPEAEPPIGFESRVLAEARPPHPRRRGRLAAAVVGAAAVLGGLGATLVAALGGGSPQVAAPKIEHPPSVSEPASGSEARSAVLLASDHRRLGEVVAYTGRPAWVLMTVDDQQVSGPVVCEIETTDGRTVRLGTFRVTGGHGVWGATVSIPPDQIRSASLLTPTGTALASARL